MQAGCRDQGLHRLQPKAYYSAQTGTLFWNIFRVTNTPFHYLGPYLSLNPYARVKTSGHSLVLVEPSQILLLALSVKLFMDFRSVCSDGHVP